MFSLVLLCLFSRLLACVAPVHNHVYLGGLCFYFDNRVTVTIAYYINICLLASYAYIEALPLMTKKVPKKILRIERNFFVNLRKNVFGRQRLAAPRRQRQFFWTGGAPPPPQKRR